MLKTKGFTMIELMIVVLIIGILSIIAYPNYREHVIKTNRRDTQGTLVELGQFMERYYTQNYRYTQADGSAPDLPFTQSPLDGATKHYNLSLPFITTTAYTLQATPIAGGSQDGNGNLQLDSTGAKRWDANHDGDYSDDGENTW